MSPIRIFAVLFLIIAIFGLFIHLMTRLMVSEDNDAMLLSFDMSRPRAPTEARGIKNPIPISGEVISVGKAIYQGKGNCYVCHGAEGRGDGEAGILLVPPPRDLTDAQFQFLRRDGEIFWSIKFGVLATGMFPYVPRVISEEEAWMVVHYIRSIRSNRQM